MGVLYEICKEVRDMNNTITPEEFEEYTAYGESKGVKVISGPLVRSSYQARATYNSLCHFK